MFSSLHFSCRCLNLRIVCFSLKAPTPSISPAPAPADSTAANAPAGPQSESVLDISSNSDLLAERRAIVLGSQGFEISGSNINNLKLNPRYSPAFRIILFNHRHYSMTTPPHLIAEFSNLQKSLAEFTHSKAEETDIQIDAFKAQKLQELADNVASAVRERDTLWSCVLKNNSEVEGQENQVENENNSTIVMNENSQEEGKLISPGSASSSSLEFRTRKRNQKLEETLPGSYKEISSSYRISSSSIEKTSNSSQISLNVSSSVPRSIMAKKVDSQYAISSGEITPLSTSAKKVKFVDLKTERKEKISYKKGRNI
ncbi:hypothetical protein HK096_005811 [Nowakowskiella sp. JEL0078]|nr:hypothetical protein HK096_005811 [Nowakowskiella sp. JEL0078]